MFHKPSVLDAYLAEKVKYSGIASTWKIKNIKCPLCELETEIILNNGHHGSELHDIDSKVNVKCKNCEWTYNCYSFSWSEFENENKEHNILYENFDMLAWKFFCKIWEKTHKLYIEEVELIKKKIQYCKERNIWFSKDKKETPICPFCRGEDITTTEDEDIINFWCFNVTDCSYFGAYRKNKNYTFGINNNLNFNCEEMKRLIGENYSINIEYLDNEYDYCYDILDRIIEHNDKETVTINKKEYEVSYKSIHNLKNHNFVYIID